MIIIARVLYGLADRGQLPSVLAKVDGPRVPGDGHIDQCLRHSRAVPCRAAFGPRGHRLDGTLLVFVVINVALIAIKRREAVPPPNIFLCPTKVPYAGALASAALLCADARGRI